MHKETIKFEFNAAVQEALEHFPELRTDTTFYNLKSDKIIKAPEYREKMLRPLWQTYGRAKASETISNPDTGMQIMLFHPNENKPLGINDGSFEFDHELAHLIANKQNLYQASSKLYNENLADAFATIRQIQRIGTAGLEDLKRINIFRSLQEITGKANDYLTSPVISQIITDSEQEEFKKLSLTETFNKAVEYTQKTSINKEAYELLKAEYKPFEKMETTEEMLKLLSSTCLSSENSAVFISGAQVVLHHTAKENAEWQEVHSALEQKAAELQVTHLIKNFSSPSF